MKTPVPHEPGIAIVPSLVFILGYPLKHSFSPLMHNAAFRALRMPWVYAPLEIPHDQLQTAVENLRSVNVQGANVTIPYKKEVLPYLDQVEKEASWLDSVNTIFRREDKLFGASTDGEGFLRSLGPWRMKLKGSQGLVVGAGGAARPVAAALARSGVKSILVANRSPERARHLSRLLSKRHPKLRMGVVSLKDGEKLLRNCHWVIQSTALGLKAGDPSPLSLKAAKPGTLVVDLIYHRETAFLQEARRLHLPNLNGMGMLLHQGALSFEYWTGRKAPLRIMREVLSRRVTST
jgi:shikimate dehydrogenase